MYCTRITTRQGHQLNINTMDEIRLRTMTEKSILHSHKYEGCSVGMVLASDPKHLVYLYYNLECVNFMPDILDELGIVDEIRIEKPSTNGEMYGWWKNMRKERIGEEEYTHTVTHERRVTRNQSHKSERVLSGGSKEKLKAYQHKKMGR